MVAGAVVCVVLLAATFHGAPTLVRALVGPSGSGDFMARRARVELVDRLLVKPYQVLTTPAQRHCGDALDLLQIDVEPERLDRLNADLPGSGWQFVPGRFSVVSGVGPRQSWRAKVRYRGDMPLHWDSVHRSWRITLPRGETYDSARRLNIVNPRTANAIVTYLNSWVAERMGLLTPRVQFVGMSLNGKWRGVYHLLEQVDEYFLLRRDLPEGAIYKGDQADTARSTDRLFDSVDPWRTGFFPGDNPEFDAIERLIEITNEPGEDALVLALEELFDMGELLKYVAYFDYVSSVHTDDRHNHKYYLDPVLGRLRPIVWDPDGFGYQNLPGGSDLAQGGIFVPFDAIANKLFGRIKSNPALAHRKNMLLAEAIDGPLRLAEVRAEAHRVHALIREDMRHDLYKDQGGVERYVVPVTNRTFEESVARLDAWLVEQDVRLRKCLRGANAAPSVAGDTGPNGEPTRIVITADWPIAALSRPAEIIRLGPGTERILEDVTVATDQELVILPGTRLRFGAGVSIFARGPVKAISTPSNPIRFEAADASEGAWGVMALIGAGADGSVFSHCVFNGGGEAQRGFVRFTGMLSAHRATVRVADCVFRHARGDDAVNVKQAEATLERCRFEDNDHDAIDFDFCGGVIRDCVIVRSGNDGIDLGTAWPTIEGCTVERCLDKGLSVGERSRPLISDCRVVGCGIGLASKDEAAPVVVDTDFYGNEVAVAGYRKKTKYRGAGGRVRRCTFRDNGLLYRNDSLSVIAFGQCTLVLGVGELRPQFLPSGVTVASRNDRGLSIVGAGSAGMGDLVPTGVRADMSPAHEVGSHPNED